jgi:hypothetical protein
MLNIKRWSFAMLALIVSVSAQATGYFRSVDPLDQLRLPTDADGVVAKTAYQHGYVAGVAEQARQRIWCPSAGLSADQVYDVVSLYLKDHPAAAVLGAPAVVTTALSESFPCRRE